MQKLHVAAVDPSTGQSRASSTLRVYVGWTFNLASLYADDEVTPLPNPLTADTAGRAAFKVPDGEYDIEVSGAGFTPYKITLVQAMDKDHYATKADLNSIVAGSITVQMLTYVDAKLEFGAKGDGITDDWASIQQAINARRGPVYLRPGVYRISQNLELWDSTVLLGAGTHLTQIKPLTSGYHAITIANVSYAQVRDLQVVSPVTSGGVHGINITLCYFCIVQNVSFAGHWEYGLFIQQGGDHSIRDCYISNVTHGFGCYQTSNNSFWNCLVQNCSHGWHTNETHNTTLYNVGVYNFEFTGIASTGPCSRLIVIVGTFSNPALKGNWLWSNYNLDLCWFIGVGTANSYPVSAPVNSNYWVLGDNDQYTNTGRVWATSSIRAWGQLSTLGYQGAAVLGILSVARLGVGQLRVYWAVPAVFESTSYSVTVTAVDTTGTPLCSSISLQTSEYCDVRWFSTVGGAHGQFWDTSFNLQAGGKIIDVPR